MISALMTAVSNLQHYACPLIVCCWLSVAGCGGIFAGVGTHYHVPPQHISDLKANGAAVTFVARGFQNLSSHITSVQFEYRRCDSPPFTAVKCVAEQEENERVTYRAMFPGSVSESECLEYRFVFVFDGTTNYTQVYRIEP